MKILVEVSARHVHLSKNDFEVLFGKNTELSVRKKLSQPGQFASVQEMKLKMSLFWDLSELKLKWKYL